MARMPSSTSTLSKYFLVSALFILFTASSCKQNAVDPEPDVFQLLKVSTQQGTLSTSNTNNEILENAVITIEFTSPVDTALTSATITLEKISDGSIVQTVVRYEEDARVIKLDPVEDLSLNTEFRLTISDEIQSAMGASFPGVVYTFNTRGGTLQLVRSTINGGNFSQTSLTRNIAYNGVTIEFEFSEALDPQTYSSSFTNSGAITFNKSLSGDGKTVTLTNGEELDYYRSYSIFVSNSLSSENELEFSGFTGSFQTGLNVTPKFPSISDDELLTKVQEQTFKYFWDFAHPVSGLARERNTSGDIVTIGGSGFGLMAILVGIERGFITKNEGIIRLQKIVTFLGNADRFHGAWPHWLNGSTGDVVPFSTMDDGADLVETAFMAQGLIAVRQYLDASITDESELIVDINELLDAIEWNWFTRGDRDILYWHWSPNFEWGMNLPIRGYNESLIVYFLASSSKNYAIDKEVYTEGWAASGGIRNGDLYYGITLPVGFEFGGPLFFAHYSFLGLDPRGLSDAYANYFTQNKNHTLINRAHSIENPNNYVGYSGESWGITASDEPGGYSAHEPTNDNGTLTPTAALSSMPFTPEESMDALRHFYYILGDKLWGEYGFYDAFNPTESWWASSYLAIDQGPIIIMIENHRTGLLWDLFMEAPEVQEALDNLDFTITE